MSSLQTQIEERGARIFDLVDRHPESVFSKAGFYQRMMALSMRVEHFKVQMFRFVDVLASLRRSGDIVQHLEEIFRGPRSMRGERFRREFHGLPCVSRASFRGSAVVLRLQRLAQWPASSSPEKIRTTS